MDCLAAFDVSVPHVLVDHEENREVVVLTLIKLIVLLDDADTDLRDVVLQRLECSLECIFDATDPIHELIWPGGTG